MKNGLKRIGYFIIVIILFALVKVVSKELFKKSFSKSKELTYDDSLKIYVESFERIEDSLNRFPVQVDDITFMDSVKLSKIENSIHYYYSIKKYHKADIDLKMLNDLLKPSIDSSVQNNVTMSINRRFKTKFYYSYYDSEGNFLTTIRAEYK